MSVLKHIRLLLPLAVLLSLTGCESFGGNEYPPDVTEILRVEVEPDPVATGDTATITCVIEDSLDASLEFIWLLPSVSGGFVETTTNQYQWIAPTRPDSAYYFQVKVIRPGDGDVHHVQRPFTVQVVE